jgi:hypothetical protein
MKRDLDLNWVSPKADRKIFPKMKELICNYLCFGKTEINQFDPISGGVFLKQGYLDYHYFMESFAT